MSDGKDLIGCGLVQIVKLAMVVLAILGIVAAAFLFVCGDVKAGGPVEAPSRITMPRSLNQQPGESYMDWAIRVEPWRELVNQINNNNRFVFEAIRNPLIQSVSVFFPRVIGWDGLVVALPKAYRDTTFECFVNIADTAYYSGGTGYDTEICARPLDVDAVLLSAFDIPIVIHDSDTGVYVDVLTVGVRP